MSTWRITWLVSIFGLGTGCARDAKMTWPAQAASPSDSSQAIANPTQAQPARPVPKRAASVVSVALSDSPPALIWPMEPRAITSPFGPRADPLEPEQRRFHRGVDMAAHYGALVRASAAGLVSEGEWKGNHGRHVRIEHRGGMVTSYSHLSLILVEPGAWVEPGDPVGLVGESGRTTGPHLHFEAQLNGQALDPLTLLPDLPSRDTRITSK